MKLYRVRKEEKKSTIYIHMDSPIFIFCMKILINVLLHLNEMLVGTQNCAKGSVLSPALLLQPGVWGLTASALRRGK